MRQLTQSAILHGGRLLSKLPMRQLTNETRKSRVGSISKLPMRQLTICISA